jgi:N-acetylneuraminate synthase
MVDAIEVAGQRIGRGQPCFVIAEAGVNHNGSIEAALQMVELAEKAGADAVKFQTFRAEQLVTSGAPKAQYQLRYTSATESQYEMLRRLELAPSAYGRLIDCCRERGILFLSSPFDEQSAGLLYDLGVPAFKIPSGEITNLPLLEHIGRYQRPMIVSTGTACLNEVETAVDTIAECGNREIILLHCVSCYPANAQDVNLRAMHTMAAAFGLPVGYSDHTLGMEIALAAVALGACVLEKHFTLDRSLPGPDQATSLDPVEFTTMVKAIRSVEAALGHGRKEPAASEADAAAVVRKSLVAAADIPAGTKITEDVISMKRPGTGLPPAARAQVMGRIARSNIAAGTLLSWDLLA